MKTAFVTLLILVFTAGGAVSQDKTDTRESTIAYDEIMGDVNGDGIDDYVSDITLPHGRRLVVIEEGRSADGGLRTLMTSLAFEHPNKTDHPGVRINRSGGIEIVSGCVALCGRFHEVVTHKFAYRNGHYILSGYTELIVDRLDATGVSCDVNLLTGQVELVHRDDSKSTAQTADRAIRLGEFDSGYRPSVCKEQGESFE